MKQVIIVTGASSGMGVEFAVQLAKESVQFPEYKTKSGWLQEEKKNLKKPGKEFTEKFLMDQK